MVRWLETNHQARLFQHNKFIVFDRRSVLLGAGNFTTDAFTKNYENFYMVRIPSVVARFRDQFELFWNDLATEAARMPIRNVSP